MTENRVLEQFMGYKQDNYFQLHFKEAITTMTYGILLYTTIQKTEYHWY